MKKLCILVICLGVGFSSIAAAGITQGFVTGADNVAIHYRADGPRNAPRTILLIPGWRISSIIWIKQLQYFSRIGDRVIAMDSRSQGGSSVVYARNSPEDRSDDIHAVIKRLKLSRITLVGWSQGTQDVSAYVDRYGTDHIDDIVMVDSPVSTGPDITATGRGFLNVILRGIAIYSRSPRAYSNGMMHAIISVPIPAAMLHELVRESMRTPVDVGISMLVQDLFTVDRRPYLEKFDKPTLVVASSRSQLLKAQQQMASQLPMGRFLVIHKASHALFYDRPDIFNHALEAFMEKVSTHRRARP